MEAKYVCSYCDQTLNVGKDIVLVAKNDVGEKGLIMLHAELGNYTSKFSPGFSLIEGDLINFSCPICKHKLTNRKNEKLANFIHIDENEKKFDIVISAIYGEKCTYKIEEHEVIETFGDHWARYQNPDWFLLF
ncbi:MAG: hypothetical protein PF517_02565 [Salinivirgaceae bacterium]|jgi:hypothetical protein|nr:hypothetical protein [Salinivirgaceae bacterium]